MTAATLNALHELAIASGTRGVRDVARLAADHARSLLGVDAAVVFSYDAEHRVLIPVGETDSPVPESPVTPGEGAIGLAFDTGLPVVIDDYQSWEAAVPGSAARGMVSAIAVPLIAGDRPVGALGVWTYQPRSFRAEQEQLLTLFAAQVAPALEAAHLNQQRAATARIFEALHELSVATGGMHDAAGMAALCVERAMTLLGADGATLTWWDDEQGVLRPLAETGTPGSAGWRLRPGDGANGVAFKWKEAVAVADYPSWPHSSHEGRLRGFESVLAVPLVVRDRAVGSLGVQTMSRRDFGARDIELMRLFAAQVAPALEAARLIETGAGQVRELRSLHEIAVAASGVLEPRRLASLVVQEACALLGADRVVLRTWDAGRGQLVALADSAGDEVPPVGLTEGLPGRVFESGRPATVEDQRGWAAGDGWAREAGFASAVMVPLVSHQRPTGVLGAFTTDARRFREREIRLLSLLAAQVAPALEAAELAAARRESEERFRAVFERAAIGIAHLDLAGRVIAANPALHRILGETEDGLPGHLFDDLVHPDDRGVLHLPRLAAGEASEHQVEMRYLGQGGAEVWGNTIASSVRGEAGQPQFVIVMVEDVTLRRAHQAALEHRALHDPLTDLPNRTLLQDRLQQAILAARRDREVGAVLVIDLDGFKQVNDQHGHHCGDELLRQIADRMRGQLRGSDTVARLGGDEFAVVLPDIGGAAGARRAATKLSAALRAPFQVESHRVTVAASIGTALFPDEGEEPEELMRRADASMYDRKRARR